MSELGDCRRCGMPAVAGELCHHDATLGLRALDAILALVDTDADLTDPDAVRAWVRTVQAEATRAAEQTAWVPAFALLEEVA